MMTGSDRAPGYSDNMVLLLTKWTYVWTYLWTYLWTDVLMYHVMGNVSRVSTRFEKFQVFAGCLTKDVLIILYDTVTVHGNHSICHFPSSKHHSFGKSYNHV